MNKLTIFGLLIAILLFPVCMPDEDESNPTSSTRTSVLRFDGINDWVTVTDFNFFEFGLSDFSIELWVRVVERDKDQRLFGKALSGHVDGEARWLIMVDSANVVNVLMEDAENTADPLLVKGTKDIADAQWHHIAVVFDRDEALSLYIDGELELEDAGLPSYSGSVSNQGNVNLYLGCTADQSEFFSGDVTNLRMWSVALAKEQIVERMHQLLGGIVAGLVANWKMTEGNGQLMVDYAGGRNGLLGSGPESDVNDPAWIPIIHP